MAVPLLITRSLQDTLPALPPEWRPVLAPTVELVAAGAPEALAAGAPLRPVLAVSTPRSVPVATLLAPGRSVFALAPRTSRELRDAGVTVHEVTGGVAELIASAHPSETLLLTSDLGAARAAREWPGLALLVTHHTRCPAALPAPALAALASGAPFDVLVASPSAADNLERLAPGALVRARRVLCHGASTLAAARAHGAHAEPFTLGA